jgi:hypothetical protein
MLDASKATASKPIETPTDLGFLEGKPQEKGEGSLPPDKVD